MAPVKNHHLPSITHHLPLIVIVGPTASGKTSLAIELAEKYGGEIICADSRTVYQGLDIGTAKPSADDQKRVKHWGVDLVGPGERFTAADFKQYALDKINNIRSRGKIPFLVGGTGLYVDGVIFDYEFGLKNDDFDRGEYESMTIDELRTYCRNNNITMPENIQNKRYIIRAIENNGVNTSRNIDPITNTVIVGITTDKILLKQRIKQRTEQIFEDGIVNEANNMSKLYGWNSEPMTGNIYRIVHELIEEKVSLSESKSKAETLDWRLAKRQLTWFKRNSFIKWLNLHDAEVYLSDLLAKLASS